MCRAGKVETLRHLLYDTIMKPCLFVIFATLWGSDGFTTTNSAQIVRIGGMYPLTDISTGLMNPLGSQWLAGSLMAMRDLNIEYATRNIKFELAVRDSRRTFSNTVEGSLELSRNVFKNTGTHIIVGAGFNPVSEAMAYVFSDPQNDLAQIAYASNTSTLSHGSVFPDFMRTYPSSSYECYALADTIVKYFGYTRVVLIYNSGMYGTDGAIEFTLAAARLGINIVATVTFDPFETDFSSFLDPIKKYDARIFVLIIGTVKQAGALISYAAKIGLLNDKTNVLGTSSLASKSLWTTSSMTQSQVLQTMGGLFALSNADNDWKVTPKGANFIKNFRSQPNTRGSIGPNGRVCNTSTDDDGGYMLYQSSLNGQAPYNCGGFNFSLFSKDGRNIAAFTAYAYDATMAAGYGVTAYADSSFGGQIPARIDGISLKRAIIDNVSFDGYSGPIKFSTGRPGISFYGHGDRESGVRFSLMNFDPGNGSSSTFRLNRVGTWTTETGFSTCTSDATLQSAVTGGCFRVIYGTVGNEKPRDRPSATTQRMPTKARIALFLLAAFNFCMIVFFMYILVKFGKTRLLKASQPSMMWIVITSNLFNVVRTVLAAVDPSVTKCSLDIWFGHLAFISVIAMFAKTLRIFLIIKSGLRRIKVTAAHVLSFTACWYGAWLLYLLFISIFASPIVLDTVSVAITGQATSQFTCSSQSPAMMTVLYAFEGAFLAGSGYLCYATKDVPDAINEAKVVALSLIVITAACAAGFSLTLSVGLNGPQQELVVGVCFFLASVGSMFFYFGYKAVLLLSGASLNAQFKIVRKGDERGGDRDHDRNRVPTSSKSPGAALPQNIPDCEAQILLLQGQLMILLEKAVNLASGSLSQSAGIPSYRVDRNIELKSSIDMCSLNEYKVVDMGVPSDAQRKYCPKNRVTNKAGFVEGQGHHGSATVNSSIDMDAALGAGTYAEGPGQGQMLSLFDHSSRSIKVTPVVHQDD